MKISHINEQGYAQMVDVTAKDESIREAWAQAVVRMLPATLQTIREGGIKKGDVLAVAQVAGIMAAKQTPTLIPMCHPLMLNHVDIEFTFNEGLSVLIIKSRVKTTGRTGVEMEAMTAAAVAALTVYDMCKAIDRWMEIDQIQLLEKSGGKSGQMIREHIPNVAGSREGRIHSISISTERDQLKSEVDEAMVITDYGIENDGQAGDWSRQVTCLSWESVMQVNREMNLAISPGQFAENVLIEGMDLSRVGPGSRIKMGSGTILEVSQVGAEDYLGLVTRTYGVSLLPKEGLFCKVLQGGRIRKGDPVEVLANV